MIKVGVVAQHEHLAVCQHLEDERLLLAQAALEIVHRVQVGVDLAAQDALGHRQAVQQFAIGRVFPDQQQFHRGGGIFRFLDRGAVHEGHAQLRAHGRQRRIEHAHQAEGFLDQAGQFGIDQVVLVGAELAHIADAFGHDQARLVQALEFALRRGAAQPGQAHDFIEVESLIHAHEQQAQQFLLGGSK